MEDEIVHFTAFLGDVRLASGPLANVLPVVKAKFDEDPGQAIFFFDDSSGRQRDFILRGTLDEVLAAALPSPVRSGPGRPKLGVVSREISLLPRHWEWLEEQSGGASAAIRRLVDEARKHEPDAQRVRRSKEAAGRFLTAMAGNRPGYEEATRALYAGHRARFEALTESWPPDIRDHARRLAEPAFSPEEDGPARPAAS